VPRGSFAPGEPIGSGFSALIFFGSFLYQDKKEHITDSLPKFCHGDEKNPNSSLEKPLLASPTRSPGSSFQTYFAPSGLVKNCSLYSRGCAPCYLLRPFGALV